MNLIIYIYIMPLTTGYHGSVCDLIDGCYGAEPCGGRGHCRPMENARHGEFECRCGEDFYGDRCQEVKNACSPNPCSNSAYCTQRLVNATGSRDQSVVTSNLGTTDANHGFTDKTGQFTTPPSVQSMVSDATTSSVFLNEKATASNDGM